MKLSDLTSFIKRDRWMAIPVLLSIVLSLTTNSLGYGVASIEGGFAFVGILCFFSIIYWIISDRIKKKKSFKDFSIQTFEAKYGTVKNHKILKHLDVIDKINEFTEIKDGDIAINFVVDDTHLLNDDKENDPDRGKTKDLFLDIRIRKIYKNGDTIKF